MCCYNMEDKVLCFVFFRQRYQVGEGGGKGGGPIGFCGNPTPQEAIDTWLKSDCKLLLLKVV